MLGFALDRLGSDTQMDGRLKRNSLLLIGAAIDTKINATQCQVMVLAFEPTIPQGNEVAN